MSRISLKTSTDAQVTNDVSRNLWILKLVAVANNGYLFAIAVMIDFLNRIMAGGYENLFYLESTSTLIFLTVVLWLGIFSDIYNRKLALILGMTIRLFGWVILLYAGNYSLILLAFIFEAISSELCRPSHCLYETLEAAGRLEEYTKFEQRLNAFPLYVLMIGLPVSGFFYEFNIYLPVALNVLACFICLIGLMFYKEPDRKKLEKKPILIFTYDIFCFFKLNKSLTCFMAFFALIHSFALMVIFLFQAKYLTINDNAFLFACIIPLIYAIRGFSAQKIDFFTSRLSKKISFKVGYCSCFHV